ncbi:heterogeneous nuclear ribonucleoprotein A0 [Protopterus annectens]|uniref:heterogeneous nuclear ribonucleoprotein A0 n=1 Tax=Protopterus annectens TaxID=7888 RepID=UPI001CFA66F8|nr:heterogeneous nuclear ribonucleoprotein A0 [Protopterus annectens]
MDSQLCKLFIGGLNLQTTEATLREHFEKFGELTDCVVVVNPLTKRSRCFGFVTYANAAEADSAMAATPHVLDGNNVELKRAVAREDAGKPGVHAKVKKIFVGGIKEDLEEEDLNNHFSQFGEIDKVEIIADKQSGKKRGFGFIYFSDYDSADKTAVIKFHTINGHRVEVKKAVPKDELGSGRPSRGGARGGGARGGRGGARAQNGGGNYGGGYAGGYGTFGQSYFGNSSYSGYSDTNGLGSYGQQQSSYGPMKGGGYAARSFSSGPYRGGYGGGYF